jgi:hypothetical protein
MTFFRVELSGNKVTFTHNTRKFNSIISDPQLPLLIVNYTGDMNE